MSGMTVPFKRTQEHKKRTNSQKVIAIFRYGGNQIAEHSLYAERRYGQKPWVSTQETLKSLTNVELCTQSGLLGRAFVQGMAHPLNTCG